jgi:hypothetical protein
VANRAKRQSAERCPGVTVWRSVDRRPLLDVDSSNRVLSKVVILFIKC